MTILLDKNWQVKIAGLGLSMIGPELPNIFVNDGLINTPGYDDPTYLQTGVITKETDVYSFGVVLFEVLCGREAYDRSLNNKRFLGPLAQAHYQQGTLNQIVDPLLMEQMSQESLKDFSSIAYQCLEKLPAARPTMIEIVQKLENVLRLQQDFEKALALQREALAPKGKQEDKAASYKVKNLEHMKIPLEQIKLATHDFHDDFKIGRGGYGKVYKADLFHFDVQKYSRDNKHQNASVTELLGYQRRKSTVAVKRLDRRYGQGTTEFLQEISVLPYFRHQNLVTLVGFCDEDQERILVYEYASNGSLDDYILRTGSRSNYSWAQHLQICLDAARGLQFLHNGVGEHHRIIHRDIKSSNILLGQNWVGKISDFGLSRIGPANLQATFVMTQVAGTLEYVDPQYNKTGMLTKESDVYSFGVVLFEVLSGRLAYFPRSKDDQEYLPHMAKRCFEENKLNELINTGLKEEFEKRSINFDGKTFPESICIFSAIAYQCLQENRDDRPTMSDIVEELEKALKSQVKGVEALRTSIEAIKFVTHDFSEMMEHEGYVKVYKGALLHSKGHKAVIVKRQDLKVGSYENDFYREIAILYSFSCKNVIPPILGFCEDASQRIVVFEHMVNGSLNEHVKSTSLTWKQRLKICIDIAHGLSYIHSGSNPQYSTHGSIKSSSILLNNDWKAFLSDFIISKGVNTLGYHDQLYATTGLLTQKSDVYSFGVVLCEILSGKLAVEPLKIDQKQPLPGDHEASQVIFLSQWATQCFENKRLDEIIFHDIKDQIDAKSLDIFSTLVYRCLQEQQKDRPTMGEVVKELENAYECQDEWEWEQKLPEDYKKIISMSKFPLAGTSRSKDLYSFLSSGILLQNENLWFSIGINGVKNETVSARLFSFKNVKWRSIKKSRFSKVAKIPDISNLNIRIHIKPQLLTPNITYGAYLVFKFCNRRKVSTQPLYVNLKYKMAGETSNAYFAKWTAGGEWLMAKLFQFCNDNETTDFDLLLESFSIYHNCGNWGVYVEGLEFSAIHSVSTLDKYKENKEPNDEKNVQRLLKHDLYNDYEDIIKRSENNIQNAPKDKLHLLLFNGIVIDRGEKIFSLSKVNGKKCHMLRAKAVIPNASNVKFYNIKPQAQSRCRFDDAVEILSYHEFRIKCDIETRMLSSDTSYACFLVFKLSEKCHGLKCPVKARGLLPYRKQRSNIISFTTPNTMNLNDIKWIPRQRGDGWMEVIVWETNNISDMHNEKFIPMDLKLICFEGTMYGLIICGVEFRPVPYK
ncbi:hypothetical protein QVD17_01726 [Tagetes erecta]|uniref:non-specific serine/threonine protein kinase n=1 Tax=Tagetes erecta TaxID=13708 RepID=A0AAD8LAA7_TARER|nr:hypothetical protein QVD17_01726 [Tagetes erecta]